MRPPPPTSHADSAQRPSLGSWLPALAWACWLCAAAPAMAEKADRSKPYVIEADQGANFDGARQVGALTGNVVITQGSMVLRADRVELRVVADGYRAATATGSAERPATWRQRSDRPDEVLEGSAERIEYDGRADTLRLLGAGVLRRLRGGQVIDEVSGASISWDNGSEQFSVEGGQRTAANPGGRLRAVLSPRAEPASAPAAATTPLQPSRPTGAPR